MEFFTNYGMFLAKTATFVIAVIILFAFITSLSEKSKRAQKGKLSIQKINDKLDDLADIINESIQTKAEIKTLKKQTKEKQKKKKTKTNPHRIFVIQFNGDVKASAVDALRKEITAILLTARSSDRVLCCIESPGGLVHSYGLAASQLRRLREAKIKLTVAVDKVAASGGYLMACVADEIIAAPFAIIGSIGVVAQLPNFHRFLEKKNIDFEQITAGEYKRTLTMFGKNTEKGREKMQEDVNDTHELFKNFITENRPSVDISKVATGEHWHAIRAIDLNLIDALKTSDDYILESKDRYDIYKVKYHIKKPLSQRFSDTTSSWMSKLTNAEF